MTLTNSIQQNAQANEQAAQEKEKSEQLLHEQAFQRDLNKLTSIMSETLKKAVQQPDTQEWSPFIPDYAEGTYEETTVFYKIEQLSEGINLDPGPYYPNRRLSTYIQDQMNEDYRSFIKDFKSKLFILELSPRGLIFTGRLSRDHVEKLADSFETVHAEDDWIDSDTGSGRSGGFLAKGMDELEEAAIQKVAHQNADLIKQNNILICGTSILTEADSVIETFKRLYAKREMQALTRGKITPQKKSSATVWSLVILGVVIAYFFAPSIFQ